MTEVLRLRVVSERNVPPPSHERDAIAIALAGLRAAKKDFGAHSYIVAVAHQHDEWRAVLHRVMSRMTSEAIEAMALQLERSGCGDYAIVASDMSAGSSCGNPVGIYRVGADRFSFLLVVGDDRVGIVTRPLPELRVDALMLEGLNPLIVQRGGKA